MSSKKTTTAKLIALPLSHQAGKERYANIEVPLSTPWRNNLTALSQYLNLFFVAYGDSIHVFRPTFPEQKVPAPPARIINYNEFCQNKPGYIDPLEPHAANHIIVGDLGNEEVLIIACDSGNVLGFRTRSIAEALEEVPGDDGRRLTPFFAQDVGNSAWGLALHKAARVIAVSSNSQKILVFAFALGRGPDTSTKNSETVQPTDNDLWVFGDYFMSFDRPSSLRSTGAHRAKTRHSWKLNTRKYHLVIGLTGHKTNVPNISFWNSENESSQGQIYLASTDISGKTSVWKVWSNREIFNIVPSGICNTGSRGWNALCLDPRFYCPSVGPRDTYGTKRVTNIPSRFMIGNSACVESVEDNSPFHPAFTRFSVIPVYYNQGQSLPLAIGNHAASAGSDTMAANSETGDEEGGEDEGEDEDDSGEEAADLDVGNSSNINQVALQTPPENSEESRSDSEESDHFIRCADTDHLDFNLLVTGEAEICLLRDLHDYKLGKQERPSIQGVFCKNALRQRLPQGISHLRQFERLNMIHQIPELGVVAVGNQIGRVALLTMTHWLDKTKWHYSQGFGPSDAAPEHEGFKISAILPFYSQETKNLRPEQPLLGMAVSPIQGQETSSEGLGGGLRKFRLLMTYYDHTILSYEISRDTPGGDLMVF